MDVVVECQWTCDAAGLRFDSVLISFQRFKRPADDLIDRAPPSFEALPVGRSQNRFLLPLAENEAFWIGALIPKMPSIQQIRLSGQTGNGQWETLAVLDTPQNVVIEGLRRVDGRFTVFCRSTLEAISAKAGQSSVLVALTDPMTYSALTAEPPPPPGP